VEGGVISATDYDFLYEHGVHFIFGPGTAITAFAEAMIDRLLNK
jgi:methylmalonyl-CoA mutase